MLETHVLPAYPQPALFEQGLDLLFPPVCVGCRRVGRWICVDCWKAVRWIHERTCFECGRPSPTVTCVRCNGKGLSLDRLIAIAEFEGTAREAVHHLKFHRHHAISSLLGRLMAEAARGVKPGVWGLRGTGAPGASSRADARFPSPSPLPDQLANAHTPSSGTGPCAASVSDFDLVAHVPLHRRRRRERGYDQSALLAKVIARNLMLPFESKVLKRTRPTEQQAALATVDRRSNVQGAFQATCRLDGRSVLLVDDVSTTGATIDAAARALREAGAGSVTGLVFAH